MNIDKMTAIVINHKNVTWFVSSMASRFSLARKDNILHDLPAIHWRDGVVVLYSLTLFFLFILFDLLFAIIIILI